MTEWLPIIVPAAISVVLGIAGAFYARRRGLPDIDAEIDSRTRDLIATLREQIDDCKPRLEATEARLKVLEEAQYQWEREKLRLYERLARAENGRRA